MKYSLILMMLGWSSLDTRPISLSMICSKVSSSGSSSSSSASSSSASASSDWSSSTALPIFMILTANFSPVASLVPTLTTAYPPVPRVSPREYSSSNGRNMLLRGFLFLRISCRREVEFVRRMVRAIPLGLSWAFASGPWQALGRDLSGRGVFLGTSGARSSPSAESSSISGTCSGVALSCPTMGRLAPGEFVTDSERRPDHELHLVKRLLAPFKVSSFSTAWRGSALLRSETFPSIWNNQTGRLQRKALLSRIEDRVDRPNRA
mmetsp:Transcript_21608/g.41221  ORF Transcript_21608/g.41221 Transcript_21608/m.41221 type:complete len:264 (+) Transcript_21608:2731-3522(+)